MTSGFFHFFSINAQRAQGRASASKNKRARRADGALKPRRLVTETLEERQLLAVDAVGALLGAAAEEANVISVSKQELSIDAIKAAIQEAASTPEDDVIEVAAGNLKFTSASDEIMIDIDEDDFGSVTIVAKGGDLNIDANGLARAFTVKNGYLRLESVNISNGKSDYGGAIANGDVVVLVDVELTNNEATVSGGAVANKGGFLAQNSVFKDNIAVDGAAIYEGDFAWPKESAPEWIKEIADVKGGKGATVVIDLADYCSEGAWTYSFDCSNVDSAIFAEMPTLEDGKLVLKFIDADKYFAEDDYSAVTFDLFASDGKTTAKTSFVAAHECQTSAVLKATLTNMSLDDVDDAYCTSWKIDGARRGTDVWVFVSEDEEETAPKSEIVDLTSENLYAQLWFKDAARAEFEVVGDGYLGENVWGDYDEDEYVITTACFYLTLDNATLNLEFDEKAQCWQGDMYDSWFYNGDEGTTYVEDCGETETGAHLYKIVYGGGSSGTKIFCGQYALLGMLQITPNDAAQPVSATLSQLSVDRDDPCIARFYDHEVTRDGSGLNYLRLDPSQTLFVSSVSNSIDPVSEIPGRPFERIFATSGADFTKSDVAFFAQNDSDDPEDEEYGLFLANVLIVGNVATGVGTINVAEGDAFVGNATIADNTASGAAFYAAGSGVHAVANSILVNDGLAPVSSNVVCLSNLLDGSSGTDPRSEKNVAYDSAKPLFNEGDYTLTTGSQALNIGNDGCAQDFIATFESDDGEFVPLKTDLAGLGRFSATVDAGAYEYQGTAPSAPTNVAVSDYVDSGKNPAISWNVPTSIDGVEGYRVYYGSNWKTTTELVFNVTDLTDLVDNSTYQFSVSAFNAYGESAAVAVTLNTLVAPTAPTNLAFGEYAGGSATLTWTGVSNAAYYQIKDASGAVVADNVGGSSYTFTGLADFATYSYTVVAVNAKGSAASEAISLDTTVAPATPTGFKVGTKYADNQLTLTWNVVDHAVGYVVYQKLDGAWREIGTASATARVVTGLNDFTNYEFAVVSYANKGAEVLKSELATLSTYTAVAPDAPTNFELASEYAGEGSVAVQWVEVANADGYLLAKREATGWSVVATTDGVGYTINNLANNAEYEYGVAAYALDDDGVKLQSDYTTLTINTIIAPDAPTNVKFDEYVGGTSATLTWTAVPGVAGYRVQLQNAQGGWDVVETTTETSLVVTVAENSQYLYQVAAFNTVGAETRFSTYVDAPLDTLVPPIGPLNLSVVDYSYVDATAKLTWNALDKADYYVVEVKAGDGAWTTVEQKFVGSSYDLTALQPNARYSFCVTAANAKGKGAVAKVEGYFTAAPPAKPSVSYNYDKDAKTATISYYSEFANKYYVYEAGELVYEGSDASYQATNLVDNESYSFTVIASNEQGDSEPTTITFTASAAPQAPVVSISAYEDAAATLTWNSVEFASGYRVYRQDGGVWTQVGTDLGADVDEYALSNLEDYKTYTFAVVAFNDQGESAYSGVASLDTTVAPATPTGLAFAADYAGDGKATLVWNVVDHAVGYTVRYVLNGEEQVIVVETNAYDVEGLANYAEYEFSVDAFAYRGAEKLASESAKITLNTRIVPTDELTVAVSEYDFVDDEATLSWNEVAHATGYRITLVEVGKATSTFDTTETSYTLSLKDNANYTYTVVAYNEKGDGSTATGKFFTYAPPATPNASFGPYDDAAKQATLIWNFVDYATSYKVQVYDETIVDWVDVELEDPQFNQYVVKNMVDFAEYRYRVAASNATGDSDWSYASITATTTPRAPQNLEYVFNGSLATITWKDVLNPSDVGYKVYQWNEETATWDFKASTASLTKTYTSNALRRYSEYRFAVTAWTKDAAGHTLESAKEDGEIVVSTDWTPGNIKNAYFVDPESYGGDGKAELVWTPAEGAVGYVIYQKENGENVLVDYAYETSYSFEGLANYAEYDFAVVAFNDYEGEGEGGRGGFSLEKPVHFSTMIPPTDPLSVVAGDYDCDAKSLKLTWNEVGFADGYKVYLTQDGEETFVETTKNLEYAFTGLNDNAEYGYKVVAYNAKGDGSECVGDFFTTAPPAAPTEVAFGEYFAETHKATLSWNGDEFAIGYVIQVKDGEDWKDVEKFWKTTNYTVSDLVDDSIYVYRVCAYNDAGFSEYVEAELDTSVKTAPKAPSDLTVAYDFATDGATLTWTDNSSNETAFVLQRSYDGNDWKDLATLDADVVAYDLGTLEVGVTYFYRVAATNVYGRSDWDFVSFAIPTPEAPTDLTFGEYDSVNYSVDLSWVDNSDNENGFKIEWSNDQKTWYSDTVAADQTSYVKDKLLEGRTYYFRVSAFNKAGSSEYATGSFDVPSVERKKPNAPSDVEFVDYDADSASVTMTWKDNSSDEEKFVVQFSYDQENWYSVKNVGYDVDSLKIEGLVEGRTYYFRVAAYNAAGYSDWCENSFTVEARIIDPPSNLSVVQQTNESVRLTWTDNSTFEDGYVVQYSYDGVNWSRVKYFDADATSADFDVVYGRSYYFRVAAYFGSSISEWLYSEKYVAPKGTPTAPTDLTVEGLETSAKLSWIDASNNEIGFNLEYSVDGGSTWISLGNASADVTTQDASKLRPGVSYTFRVRAYNAYGRSDWTTSSSYIFENENAPLAPTSAIPGAFSSDSNSLVLSWGYEAGEPENAYGYRIQYSYDGGVAWYSAGTTSKGDLDSVVSGLVGGRTYKFRVAAYNADGASAWVESEEVEIPVSDSAPQAPSALAFGEYDATTKTVELTWSDDSDVEKGYKIEYGVDGKNWSDYAYLEANSTARDITGLNAGETYYFRVAAYNAFGENYSDAVKITLNSESGVVAPEFTAIEYAPSRRQIALAWNGNAASYNVQYRYCWEDSVSSWYSLTNGTTSNNATLKNVTAGVKYEFRVQAVAENGDLSAWSRVESYDTGSMTSSLVDEEVVPTTGADFFDELDSDALDAIAASLLQ